MIKFSCILLFLVYIELIIYVYAKKPIETVTGVVLGVEVVKGNRNALFLVDDKGSRHQFPDFFTYTTLNFTADQIRKIDDKILETLPVGSYVKKIQAPPPFRPDDFMYHELCQEPRRMVIYFSI